MAGDAPYVLAVDDSLVDRTLIERLLKISACRVATVDSGIRALQFLGLEGDDKPSLKVNMIITDYCMPGMNGFELLKKIKESSALREIPVVIMSSENVVARIDRCLEEGAEDFIVKPVKLSDLKRLKGCIAKKEKEKTESIQAQSGKRKLPSSSSSSPSSSSSSTSSFLPSSSSPTPASSSSSCEQQDDTHSSSPSSEPPQKHARVDTKQHN